MLTVRWCLVVPLHNSNSSTRRGTFLAIRTVWKQTCQRFRMAKLGSIGIDVGGTKTRFALFDEKFKLVEQVKIKTQDSKNAKDFTSAVDESLDALLEKSEKDHLRVESVGVGCAGYLNGDGSVKTLRTSLFSTAIRFGGLSRSRPEPTSLRQIMSLPPCMANISLAPR